MIIRSTKWNYGSTLVHIAGTGICFIGEPQINEHPEGSRYIYPLMVVSTGECYDIEPHELIGAYIFDGVRLGWKRRELV